MSNDNSRRTREENAAFEKRAQEVLRAAAGSVPPEVNERLVAMRRLAIEKLETQSSRQWQTPWFWAPASAAAVVVIALGLFLYPGSAPTPMFDELDEAQLAAAQDMEILEELEFLAWLEEEVRNAG